MSSAVLVELKPRLFDSGRKRMEWIVSQGEHAVSGTFAACRRTLRETIEARLNEGYRVTARVHTAQGQVEEEAHYDPDGTVRMVVRVAPEGPDGMGRRCRSLPDTAHSKERFKAATKPPPRGTTPPAPAKAKPNEPKPRPAAKWVFYAHAGDIPAGVRREVPATARPGILAELHDATGEHVTDTRVYQLTEAWHGHKAGSVLVVGVGAWVGPARTIKAPRDAAPPKPRKPREAKPPRAAGEGAPRPRAGRPATPAGRAAAGTDELSRDQEAQLAALMAQGIRAGFASLSAG